MKVALISPDSIFNHGMRSIAAYLKRSGVEVVSIFLPTYDFKYKNSTLNQLSNLVSNCELLSFSSYAYSYNRCLQIIRFLKKSGKPTIWGGVFATTNPKLCLEYTDLVCIGEGEDALLELANNIKKKEIHNIWYKKNGIIIKNKIRPVRKKLEDLPFPDYDIKTNYVLDKDNKIKRLKRDNFKCNQNSIVNSYLKKQGYFILVHGSKGCPHNCEFCSNKFFNDLYKSNGEFHYRLKSVDYLISELRDLKIKFNFLQFIWFTDDTFFGRKAEEIKEFSLRYQKEIGLPFMCYGSPSTITNEKLNYLINAGLKRIEIGLQSGCEETNNLIYNRNMTEKSFLKMTEIVNQFKDRMDPPNYQLINQNPFENKQQLLETILLISKMPIPFELEVFNLVFFPGTGLYDKALKNKFIKPFPQDLNLNYLDFSINIEKKILRKKYLLYLLIDRMSGKSNKYFIGRIPRVFIKSIMNESVYNTINKNFIVKILDFILIKPKNYFFKIPNYFRKKIVRFYLRI